jgi:hypothetical protein
MDIVPAVGPQDGNGSRLVIGISGVDPQKQPAVVDLLLEVIGVVMAYKARKQSSNEPSGTASDGRRSECGGEWALRHDNGSRRDYSSDIYKTADEATLSAADRFGRNVGRSGNLRIVGNVGRPSICVAEFLLDRACTREKAQFGSIKARAQQLVDRGLQISGGMEDPDDFTDGLTLLR